MPAVSQAQQSIMGQAWALRKGMLKPSEINPKYLKAIKKIADGDMTDKDLEKFASTKREKLPHYMEDGKKYSKKPMKEAEKENLEEKNKGLDTFMPKLNPGGGIKPIVPFLNPDAKGKSKEERNKFKNLADYRDWIKQNSK
jgi:hypothetical protein